MTYEIDDEMYDILVQAVQDAAPDRKKPHTRDVLMAQIDLERRLELSKLKAEVDAALKAYERAKRFHNLVTVVKNGKKYNARIISDEI